MEKALMYETPGLTEVDFVNFAGEDQLHSSALPGGGKNDGTSDY